MVVSHGYLKNRLPYPHMQQYVPGVTASFIDRDVVQFTAMDDGGTHVSISTTDASLAGKILSWCPIEGPGAADVELLRSYVLYPGLTLTETEERALVGDYIKHYYDVGFLRYIKNKSPQHNVYLHAVGMVCSVSPTLHQEKSAAQNYAFIMNMIASNTKYIHMYVKSTQQNIALANYGEWAVFRIVAHAILRYAWTNAYNALSDLIPRGLFRTSKGAKPTVNGTPIESVVYNEYSRTMVGPDAWYNDSTRDAFMVRNSEGDEGTAVWYDDRGRRYHLVVTTTAKPNDKGVVEAGTDAVESIVWVYDEKDEPERKVVCDDVSIVKLVGPFNTPGMKYSLIERSNQQQPAGGAMLDLTSVTAPDDDTMNTATAVVAGDATAATVTTGTSGTTSADVGGSGSGGSGEPMPDEMQADYPFPDYSIYPSHSGIRGDDLIIHDPTELEMLTMYERQLFAQAAEILQDLDTYMNPGEITDALRNECSRVREYVRMLNATGTTYGHTIMIARLGGWIVDRKVVSVAEEAVANAYGALQKAVLRIRQHNMTAYKAKKAREDMIEQSRLAAMASDEAAKKSGGDGNGSNSGGGSSSSGDNSTEKNPECSLGVVASLLGAGIVIMGAGYYMLSNAGGRAGGKVTNGTRATAARSKPYDINQKRVPLQKSVTLLPPTTQKF